MSGSSPLPDSVSYMPGDVSHERRTAAPGRGVARSLIFGRALDLPIRNTRAHGLDRPPRAFRPMIGVYYGTEPERIARAAKKLAAVLAKMGTWTEQDGWLAGPNPSLAEAVAMPIHVRLTGLQRLGFTEPIPAPL